MLDDFPSTVRNRVKVISAYRREDLPALVARHHVQVFPSLSEGFGKTLLEGMTCGLAPVATGTPGPTEFVIDEQNGLLVPPRDASALERAVVRLPGDGPPLARLRRATYDSAQAFSWNRLARDRLRIYERWLYAARPHPAIIGPS